MTAATPPTPPTPPTPKLIFATPNTLTIAMDSKVSNIANSNYSGGNYGSISYASSNPSIATVDISTGIITPLAPGTTIITATQAAIAGVNLSATQSYTLTVTLAAQKISAVATATNINIGSTASISATGGSGTGSYSFTSSNTNVATINSSSGLLLGISSGSTTITVTKAADSKYASVSTSLLITVVNTLTSVTLTASQTRASEGQTFTFKAQVSPSAATGTIIFKEGNTAIGSATLSGGQAIFVTSSLSSASHTIFAVYSGDAIYPGSTSSSITVAISRPNPANDMRVRTMVAAQTEKALQQTSLHVGTVQRRLESLHNGDAPFFSNGISIAPTQTSDLPVSRYAAAMPLNTENKVAEIFGRLGQSEKLDSPPLNRANRISANDLLRPDFNIWTMGQVMLGGERILAPDLSVDQKTKFALSGITFGADKSWSEYLKGGLSYSYSSDQTRTKDEMVKSNSRSGAASVYASWNAFDHLFVDAVAGYGIARFSSARFDTNASAFLSGTRSGKIVFYSATTSYDKKLGPLFLAPFVRFDLMFARLGSYVEAGGDSWNLSYDRMTFSTQTLTLGLRGQYDFIYDFGVLSPTFRVEVHQLINGQAVQNISYGSDTSSTYSILGSALDSRSFSGALGVKFRSQVGADAGLELNFGGAGKGLPFQGTRGSLNVRF